MKSKGSSLLITSILLVNVVFLFPSLTFAPVEALDYGMDQDLGSVDASYIGEMNVDTSGMSIDIAGDVNGDGYDDIVIGAHGNNDGGGYAGKTYLIFPNNPGPMLYDNDFSLDYGMRQNLQNVNASFWGENVRDYSGRSVASAGDVNGDGNDDILIGAPYNDEGGENAGQTYLIFGKASGWSMDTDFSASTASFLGEDEGDRSGCSVAGAGDVNGDGYDDILIGACYNDDSGYNTGQTYLIFGKPSGWIMDTDLSSSDASFRGEDSNDCSGSTVAGAGDINGDGYNDILVGAKSGGAGGKTYLILGKPYGWAMDRDLSLSDASFLGEDVFDNSGYSVAGAGDVNGDGYDDILIGATGSRINKSVGQTYLIFGKAYDWMMDTCLSASDASFMGEKDAGGSGSSVAGAGDVNGDGYDDILIGAHSNDESGRSAGQTYLILGKAYGWAMDTDLSASDASFLGETYSDDSGFSVTGAGDVNGDGYDDFLIGAPGNHHYNYWEAGQSYLILGKPVGWDMDMDISAADASFIGDDRHERSGWSVAGAGDVNGDGYDDILIGADANNDGGSRAGQTYLIFPAHNSGPILYDNDLSFSYGNASTNITFSILCRFIDGGGSVNISLVIDDYWHTMITNDSIPLDFQKGFRYSYTLNLTEGIHRYYYYASNGKSIIRFPPKRNFTTPFIKIIPENHREKDSDSDGYSDTYESEMGSDWNNEKSTPFDRDGDEVPNDVDPFPDDPTRWDDDTDLELLSISKWVGLIILVILVGIFGLTIYTVRKKRTERSKESETDVLGRVGKDE